MHTFRDAKFWHNKIDLFMRALKAWKEHKYAKEIKLG